MRPSIAVLDNGLHVSQVFGIKDDVTLYYSCDLGNSPGNLLQLFRSPIIIIPFHSDQNLLKRYHDYLKEYVSNGGVLVILGANQDSGSPWMPFVQYISYYPKAENTRGYDTSNDGSILLAKLDGESALAYHDSFSGHGLLELGTLDEQKDCVIAEGYNEETDTWKPIFVVKRSGWKGSLLITTLDPDYHSSVSVYGGQGVSGEKVRLNAQILLDNILKWSLKEASSKSAQTGFAGRIPRYTREAGSADVAILTALESPELDAVLEAGGRSNWNFLRFEDDPNPYHETAITTLSGKQLRIVATSPDRQGLTSSAVLATKLLTIFHPKLLIMVGVAAGFEEGGVGFGDILVADHAIDYGSGKLSVSKSGDEVFFPSPSPVEITPRVRQILTSCKRDKSLLREIKDKFHGEKPNTELNLIIGPLGSADLVVDSPKKVSEIQHLWRKMIGVEMEVYAVYQASRHAFYPHPDYFCLKSVCDLAKDKGTKWQSYAAFVSANYAFGLIRGPLEGIFS